MVNITIQGANELAAKLSRLTRSEAIAKALQDVSEEVRTASKEAIETGKDPDTGETWKPLKKPRKSGGTKSLSAKIFFIVHNHNVRYLTDDEIAELKS